MNSSPQNLAANLAVIILAAGKGTRMKSALPKVLHPIAGQPMLWHVLNAAQALNPAKIVVVTGFGAEAVEEMVMASFPTAPITFVRQAEQKGTGHATQQTQTALQGFTGIVLNLLGDVMLNARPDVLPTLMQQVASTPAALSLLTADVPNPAGFGRIFHKNGQLVNVEEKDCNEAERKVTTANPGIYALPAAKLWELLDKLQPNNVQGEYYLTDIIGLAPKHGIEVHALSVQASRPEMGVNSRQELAEMELYFQVGKRKKMMAEGVTLIDPNSVHFATDTLIAPDVTIHPHVVFGPGVTIASNVEILSFSHLAGCSVAEGCKVGPFARLRPGTVLAENVHIGNFVEVKNSTLGTNTKANHLSYVGDAAVGENVNLGAGTITANYNRKTGQKSRTTIGAGSSTGSNTVLVAPVSLGENVTTGAGTVVRHTVEANSLVVSIPAQKTKPGYNH